MNFYLYIHIHHTYTSYIHIHHICMCVCVCVSSFVTLCKICVYIFAMWCTGRVTVTSMLHGIVLADQHCHTYITKLHEDHLLIEAVKQNTVDILVM